MTHSIDCVWYRRFKVNTCLNSKSYFCRLLFGIFIGMILAIISNVWWAIYTRYTVYDHILTFYDYHNHTKNSFTFHIYMSKWKFNGININLINNKWSEKKKLYLIVPTIIFFRLHALSNVTHIDSIHKPRNMHKANIRKTAKAIRFLYFLLCE